MPFSYDRIAPHYENKIAPLERRLLEKLRKEAIAFLPRDGRMLEFGAGTGLNFRFYHPQFHGVATEPSAQMLRIAAQKEKPRGLSMVQSYAEELPFSDGSFDGALGTLVICSVKSPDLVFKELRRVVKSGGTIALLEHVRPYGILGFAFDVANLVTVPLMSDHFNRRTSELVASAGFTIKSVKKIGWGIFNLITCVNLKDEGRRMKAEG